MSFLAAIAVGLLIGSLAYCVLTVCAACKYLSVKVPPPPALPPITVMKPLAGLDEGLIENLRSFFDQDYPEFEILLAVRNSNDPATGIARAVMAAFPSVPSRLVVVGESPSPNAKVFSLRRMFEMARHEIVVMADSDTRVDQDFLKVIAGEMADDRVGLVTCPYQAVAGDSFWSGLEAVGLNTEFFAGVLVARLLMGMDFALGPAIATRTRLLDEIGGFERLENYLAEDFVMGNLMAASGHRVVLSAYKIEHRIGSQSFGRNIEHRLRWARSTRRSRPLGYIGQLFTNPLPMALVLVALDQSYYPLALAAVLLRFAAAWVVAGRALRHPLTLRQWLLVPVQDLASFVIWFGGFFGRTVKWRGRRYSVRADGTFGLVEGEAAAS